MLARSIRARSRYDSNMSIERRALAPSILHLDEALIVVEKPAGLLSVPGRNDEACIADLLRGRDGIPADEAFRSVHRLDRDASGVIVFARTLRAQRQLTEQFASRTVEKIYWALVDGLLKGDGQVDLALAVDRNRSRAKVAAEGKPSTTTYRVIEHVAEHTLVECKPLTGRLHQIRVHLAAIDHPLAIDPIYGSPKPLYLSRLKSNYRAHFNRDERPLIDRLTLHALRISFDHPTTGARVTFEAAPPKDFRATLNQLRKLPH